MPRDEPNRVPNPRPKTHRNAAMAAPLLSSNSTVSHVLSPGSPQMDRRDFLRVAGAGSATLALPGAVSNALAEATDNPWRVYEVTTRVEVLKPAGTTRVWLPLPLVADTDYQKGLGNS